MSVLVIGGDNITPIKAVLSSLGVIEILHWDARNKNNVTKKKLPQNLDCLVFLTNFVNHNAMHKFKSEAKKRNIPFICAKRSESAIFCEFCKFLNKDGECELRSKAC
jgi:hypothetical protein